MGSIRICLCHKSLWDLCFYCSMPVAEFFIPLEEYCDNQIHWQFLPEPWNAVERHDPCQLIALQLGEFVKAREISPENYGTMADDGLENDVDLCSTKTWKSENLDAERDIL